MNEDDIYYVNSVVNNFISILKYSKNILNINEALLKLNSHNFIYDRTNPGKWVFCKICNSCLNEVYSFNINIILSCNEIMIKNIIE